MNTVLTMTIILAILLCIGVGYWLNINIGLLAISAAYLIATTMMGISVKEPVTYWPLNLFFHHLRSDLLLRLRHRQRNHGEDRQKCRVHGSRHAQHDSLCAVRAGPVGRGNRSWALCGVRVPFPLVMSVASRTGMSRLLGAIIVVSGGMATTFTSISLGGRVTQGILENAGYDAVTAADYTHTLLVDSFIFQTLVFLVAYVVLKGYQTESLDTERPAPFDAQQRRTLWLVAFIIALIIVPSTIAAFLPTGSVFATIASHIDPTSSSRSSA